MISCTTRGPIFGCGGAGGISITTVVRARPTHLELELQAPTNGAVTVFPARLTASLRSEEVVYIAERADQVPASWRRVCGVWMQVQR